MIGTESFFMLYLTLNIKQVYCPRHSRIVSCLGLLSVISKMEFKYED